MQLKPDQAVLPDEAKPNPVKEMPDQEVDGSFKNLMATAKGLKVVADGPLSQMFTATLNELYKKEVDPETGIAIESQALDVSNSQNLWIAAKLAKEAKGDEHIGMLYGVYHHEATLQDVMRVSAALEEMTEEEKARSAVVIITQERNAGNGDTFQNFHYSDVYSRHSTPLYAKDHDWANRVYRSNNVFARAIREVCESKGLKVCPSLDDFVKHAQAQAGS